MHLTDAPRGSGKEATVDGIQEAVRISSLALQGNFMGPLVAALTFVRLAYHFIFSEIPNTSAIFCRSLCWRRPPVPRLFSKSPASPP